MLQFLKNLQSFIFLLPMFSFLQPFLGTTNITLAIITFLNASHRKQTKSGQRQAFFFFSPWRPE